MTDERMADVQLAHFRQRGNGWQWQASAYQTRVRDLIAHDASLNLPGNIQSARIRGLELTTALQAGEWQLRGQLGVQHARNLGAGAASDLPRRPSRSARVALSSAPCSRATPSLPNIERAASTAASPSMRSSAQASDSTR